jgi:hypothetical protein
MSVLESKKYHAILSWSTDEKAFVIKKQEEFENIVLPECFNLSKFSSFLRKLYRWGFSKSKMHASRKCPAYANTAFKRGDVKGCIDISTTPTNYSTIDTKPIERSPGPPYPTKFDSSRSDHLVGLYEQQHAHITFKVTPSKSLGREGGLRFDNFSLLSPKSLPSLTDSVKRSRRRHEQIIAACFNNLTMQRARQELLKQKRRNVMLSLELMRMKQQQMRR